MYLPNIQAETFKKIVEFLKHLKEGNEEPSFEKPLRSSNMDELTTEWYAKFVDLEDEPLQDLLNAANDLHIKPLIHLCCAKMATIIRGLSIPDFRKRFNVVNDFTPEEEN